VGSGRAFRAARAALSDDQTPASKAALKSSQHPFYSWAARVVNKPPMVLILFFFYSLPSIFVSNLLNFQSNLI